MPDDVPYKRQRVSKACDSCRRKKVKCDGIQPSCGNCTAFCLECTYNDTTKKRGPPKGYIEAIETRLHRMESLLGGLVHSNDPRAEAVLAELMHNDLRSQHKIGKVDFTTYRNSSSDPNKSTLDSSDQSSPGSDGKDSPIIDDLNDVMGILSIDENNQVRYHGRSSGLYLLKKSDKYKDGILSIKNSSNWNHKGEVIASTQDFDLLRRPELTELPSQEISDHLLELFFTHVHPLLPLIYKPRFFDQLKDKDHLPHLLLNAIYSFAALFSDRPEVRRIRDDQSTAGEIYFDRAKALLDNDYDKARVSTIQALLILSLREYGVGKVTRGWLWSGMAARMAQDLGMHRNNEKWHPIDLTREEREEQKRVFWACFVLDRIPSAHLGRPLAIDEKDVDAAHPSEEEDDEHEMLPFKMEHLTVSSTSSPVSSSNSLMGSPVSSNTSNKCNKNFGFQSHSVSRFNHLLKLCEIMGRIIQNVYAIRSTHVSMTTDTVLSILDSSLTSWFISLPPHLQYNSSSDQPSDAPTLVLHIIYYSALMLLHQPYSVGQQSSHNICSQAANNITDIADTLMKRNILKHSLSVIVYCVFTAGVVHTYNATQEDSSISQPAKVNLAKSINILKELKSIWVTAHKYVDLLQGLVDLKDVQLDSSPNLKSNINTDGARGSRKRVNSSNSTQQPPSVGVDRHVRQARYRAQYNQSTSSDNDENDNDNSTVSSHFNTVPSSLNPPATYNQRLPPVLSFSSHVPLSSQSTRFTSSSFNQQPARQQLRHDLPESAQMFNNLGLRYMTSSTNDTQNQSTIGDTDPYAAPGMATNNNVGNNTFEPLNSGFWGIPNNADLDEWSSFIGSQQLQAQFASQTLPHLSITRGRIPSVPSSTTTGPSLQRQQQQQQVLLHNDGNDVNMFADNHPLLSDVVGINNGGGRRANSSFNNSNNGGNNNSTGDNSTVPLAYY